MADLKNCLKVTSLPQISEDELRIIFQNRRNQGGGPIDKIILNSSESSAFICFKKAEALEIILARGNFVTIDDQKVYVSKHVSDVKKERGRPRTAQSKLIETQNTPRKPPQSQAQATRPSTISQTSQKHNEREVVPNPSSQEKNDDETDLEFLVRCTIKATVNDIWKSKDFFIYYLEDPLISQGNFYEESLLLDCLNKVLYVTFEDEESADKTCRWRHGSDSNFIRVECSTKADFDTYPNKVSVHGFSLKESAEKKVFIEFVYKKTGMKVENLIQWTEPRSAVLVFSENECHDIAEVCWKLRTNYKGAKIITAPVFKTKSISVKGFPAGFDKCLLQRYFSNRRSGGGLVDSVVMQGNVAIVTFKSEDDFFGVLKKTDHALEGYTLDIVEYYECLSVSTFKKRYSLKSLGVVSSPSEAMELRSTESTAAEGSETEDRSEEEEEYYDFTDAEEVKTDLEKRDLMLLMNTNILRELQQKNKTVKIQIDSKSSKAVFQGEKISVTKARTELLQLSLMRFKSEKLTLLSKAQLELLEIDNLQQEINAEFRKEKIQAVFGVENEAAVVHFVTPTKIEDLIEKVKSFADEEAKTFSDPNAKLLFTSKLGKEFLLSLQKTSDGSSEGVLVRYEEQNNSLLIIGPQKKKTELHQRIGAFMRENVTDVKNIECSEGKIQFLNKYNKQVLDNLKEKFKPLGVIITENSKGFDVRGKKEEVAAAEKELLGIRESIHAEDFSLKFFGIKEYISEKEGRLLKTDIENDLACFICLPSGNLPHGGGHRRSPLQKSTSISLKPIPPPQVIATANFDFFTLHFMKGDLLGLHAEAIVNPLDESKQLSVSGLGKAIYARGGHQIQIDLHKTTDSELVTVTSGGHLESCQHILHVGLCKFNSESGANVETAMTAVLDSAQRKRFASIGFPCLGNGQIFSYPNLTVCIQTMNAINKFAALEPTCPEDIYICDKSDEMLSSLIDRCIQTFPDIIIEQLVELDHKPPEAAAPTPKPRQFSKLVNTQPNDLGKLRLKIVQGEITKWRVDAIVIAVDKSLDLKKGTLAKLVLRFGGDTVQQELDSNYSDGVRPGQFAQSSGGNLKCKYVFYSCLAHWKGEKGPQAQQMQSTVEDILKAADGLGLTTIAFPALGTGNLNYPKDKVAALFYDALQNYAQKNPNSKLNIDFVIYPNDTEVLDAFQEQFTSQKSAKAKSLKFLNEEDDDEDEDADDDDKSDTSSHGAFELLKSAISKVSSMMTGGGNNKTSYGSVTLTVSMGDITKEKCDAIVCSMKNSMDLSASGAVCKNLLKICGSSLQAECNNQLTAMQLTGVAKTSASGLPCQSIYFVSMEKFSSSWDQGVLEVLTEADSGGATSIALPLLGSGARNPNMNLIKKNFLSGVEQFGKSKITSLKDVRLIIFSQDMYDFFVGKAAQSSGPSKSEKSSRKVTTKPKHSVSDRVDLKIYCKDSLDADKIKKKLIHTFKDRFRSSKEENEKIKLLNLKQINDLEHEACDSRVQITIRREEGVVLLRSFFPTEKVMSKLSNLLLQAVENHHRNVIQATPTAIVWQYQEKDEKWKNFEPMMNVEIEKAHKNKAPRCLVTDSQNRKYELEFSSLQEFLVNGDGSLSKQGTKIRRFDKTKAGEPLPKRWESMGASNLKLVQIKNGGEEFKHVEQLFQQGGVSSPVKSIQRIQNKFLYQQYMVKKREMDQRNGKGFNNEKRLFHGTSPNSMSAINENGFSNNYSGVHATAYGEGTYFAVNSSYSSNYCQPDNSGQRHMYLVRVLVGKSTISRFGMKFLPNQPGTNTPYDSGTDGNNVMFIIFHDAQMYPEYLISF